jgi:hypothetical protein
MVALHAATTVSIFMAIFVWMALVHRPDMSWLSPRDLAAFVGLLLLFCALLTSIYTLLGVVFR